ncbi:hypothetical protein ACFRCI_17340 [Streptomyces sp. NPDC056638]|uniref:hypothetical protein n=1 Tax=Streptomyces sp. NPDC056638 TaxID=3345887 RepID=UPI0036C9CE43
MKVLEDRLTRLDDMLYGPIGAAVKQAQPHTEADPIGVLGAAYALLSAAFNGQVLQPGNSRPAVVWTVLVGRSTIGGKGRALNAAKAVCEDAIGKFLADRTKKGIKNAPTLIRILTEAEKGTAKSETGPDGRVIMLCEEWGATLKTLNRDSQFSEHFRMAWDGEAISNTIKGKKADEAEEEWIERPLLGFHGHIQPGIWPTAVKHTNALGGDYNRLLPVAVEEWQTLDDFNTDHNARIVSSPELVKAYEWVRDAKAGPREMRFAANAAREFANIRNTHKQHVRETSEQVTVYFERFPEQVIRIACLLAASERKTIISLGAVKAAHAFVEYSRDTVTELAESSVSTGGHGAMTVEQRVKAAIIRAGGETTRSKLNVALGLRITASMIDDAVALMDDVEREVVPSTRPGPNPVYYRIKAAQPVEPPTPPVKVTRPRTVAKKAAPAKKTSTARVPAARKTAAKKTVAKKATPAKKTAARKVSNSTGEAN